MNKLIQQHESLVQEFSELSNAYDQMSDQRESIENDASLNDEQREIALETFDAKFNFEALEQVCFKICELTQNNAFRKAYCRKEKVEDMHLSIMNDCYETLAKNVSNRERLNHLYH